MRRLILLLALGACSKSDSKAPAVASGSAAVVTPDAMTVDTAAPLSPEATARAEHLKAIGELAAKSGAPGLPLEARGVDNTDVHLTRTCAQPMLEELAKTLGADFKAKGFRRVTCDGGLAKDL